MNLTSNDQSTTMNRGRPKNPAIDESSIVEKFIKINLFLDIKLGQGDTNPGNDGNQGGCAC
jgi:hypothetical protein